MSVASAHDVIYFVMILMFVFVVVMFLLFVSRALEVTSCSQQLQRPRAAAAAASPLKICFWFCVVFVIMCNEGTLGCKYERFAFQRES